MPVTNYGVLCGHVVNTHREPDGTSPHYQIEVADDAGVHYRVAVNVKSTDAPPDLFYLVAEDFRHPVLDQLPAVGSGFTPLPSEPGHANLDFVRGNLFDPAAMRALPPLPADAAGQDNDLEDLLDHYVQQAAADQTIAVYAFGSRWPTEDVPDKVFHFSPGNGVHEIHMNQGNAADFADEDGVWQDGGLLLHLAAQSRWVAIFLAFRNQAWHTDDVTGHALTDAPPRPTTSGTEPMRVVAALVNPIGGTPEAETVTLLNASPDAVDTTGWRLADKTLTTCAVPATTLGAGATLVVAPTDGVALGNKGGTITLLDPDGLKVHGVAYTGDQADREGWTITF